ncbi:MAG: family element transposase accessory protein TnpB, partial [Pseudomonadota bacterium]
KVDKTVGIDLGLTDFLVTSDGEKVKPLKALIKYQKKLARAQKRLSKKLQGSNNAKEARLKVARLHNKISDSRKDFLHKLSTKLINENQVISLEDLDIAGMLGNHKLSKAISDASWSEFTRLD